jgi:hypothetical protein
LEVVHSAFAFLFLYWCRINCNLGIVFGFCRTKSLEAYLDGNYVALNILDY